MSERGSCRASCFVGMDFQFLLELRRPSILMLMLIFVSFGFLYIERERGRKRFDHLCTQKVPDGPVARENTTLATVNPFRSILRNHSSSKSKGFCACCGFSGELGDVYHSDTKLSRSNAVCPVCRARERHRVACLGLSFKITSSTRRVLHFGPQKEMRSQIQGIRSIDQINMDFFQETKSGKYKYSETLFGDVTKISLPDEFVDLVIILHVLEHVPRIKKALSELNRVLKHKGSMIVEVPCWHIPKSIFCGLNSTWKERIKCAGQNDHYWKYSCSDFFAMLKDASFRCTPSVCSERDLLGDLSSRNASFEIPTDAHDSGITERICQQTHHIGVQAICDKL